MAWHPFRNVGLKVAALGLGSLLWFTVTGEQVERKVTRVPIVYRNLPASLEITDQPDSVDVSIRGRYADISRIQEISIVADLGASGPGANVLPLRVDQVNVPQGVQVVQVDPGTVTVYLERADVARVPIEPNVQGEPAAGFRLGEVLVEPATVEIVGPLSRLKRTTTAVTERLSVDGRGAGSFSQVVSVGVGDAQLRLRQPTTARVTVTIEPEPRERQFENLAVGLGNLPAGREAEADPASVVVVLRGQPEALAAVDAALVRPHVDLSGLEPGEHTLDVKVNPPAPFEVAAIVPATVTVRVR